MREGTDHVLDPDTVESVALDTVDRELIAHALMYLVDCDPPLEGPAREYMTALAAHVRGESIDDIPEPATD